MTTEKRVPVDPRFLKEIEADEEKLKQLVEAATSFRAFLNHWHFLDQRTGQVKILGHELWDGQEEFVQCLTDDDFIYALKARKLGFTTLGTAYNGWVARFRDQNARVHLFSRNQFAAVELLSAVKYGLDRLPKWMQLPIERQVQDELVYDAGEDDRRFLKAYPASEDTAVEGTCTHGHVDEWARMANPARVWQAIEPSMAGTCAIITTGMGPANYTADFWRKSLRGDTKFKAFFTPALSRPDRNKKWLAAKRKEMSEVQFRQEYAMTWQDALFGGGNFTFMDAIQPNDETGKTMCSYDGDGPCRAQAQHKYIKAWDIGRHADAAVGIVIDVTVEPAQVVEYVRLREAPYPVTQGEIERMHDAYPGPTAIEKNHAGEAVAENLEISSDEILLFNTSRTSKARIIEGLVVAFENDNLRYSSEDWQQLHAEIEGYQIPDHNVVQDSVMALAIAWEHSDAPFARGRAKRIRYF